MTRSTPTYAETVRSELERQDSQDLQQRLAAGHFTDEARAIALTILGERGESAQPLTRSQPERQVISCAPSEPRSAFLGLGILASLLGLGVLGNSAQSLQYGLGVAFGQTAVASMIALPLFLVYRFFSKCGRNQALSTGFNAFALLVALTWLVLLVLRFILRIAPPG